MVVIKGIQKTSLIDYPGKVCSILFLGGCNFRCPYCQNPDLIKNIDEFPTIPEKEIIEFLLSRKKWVDAVVITGGEPTVQKDIPVFVKELKANGFLVKLDTNGTNPLMLKQLLKENALDYIAMDIKSSLENYERSAGASVKAEDIQQSVDLIMGSKINYEFRTTVLPGFFSKKEAELIGKWLKGAKNYYIQNFKSDIPLLDKSFEGKDSFSEEALEGFKKVLDDFFDNVVIR